MKYQIIKNEHCHPDQLEKGSVYSAGYDLYLTTDAGVFTMKPNQTIMMNLGFHLHINDPSVVGLIYPRSGKGTKGIVPANLTGVIDSDYQGEWKICLWNRSTGDVTVNSKDAIAQVVFTSVLHPQLTTVREFGVESIRGSGGFGSTDKP